ncbi:golgin candidate 5 isoform X2 [Phalaenopsis equestris]|uniref:golgin candidate 5 isoform X1 n=1 Tax=Phalaenopsis equestris TaxID=78828 RepID=UPI0009E353F1|nr:golgin candidate 5 isoform X1 [Phalaenopsis equestris]XP_020579364.1 golgin candidate 5 isoform X2 [Phalaenopsis equestris]XP_020579365.1 golgin candidate 5 isoform X1 [Phalaenopsis equestris]XP_020579366.1 golgin candidate 5 isoform X2 [Phalaenopsis equestris]XP_020579367.1 golgin candidate 5 isoform X2 [Phalaenopsis equestris]
MAWLGKVSLGGFPDLAGAVTKLSESVKNIEKNFDSALGLEEKSDSGEASRLWPSAAERKALFDPVMAFMGNRGEEPRNKGDGGAVEVSEKVKTSEHLASEEKQDELPGAVSPISKAETEVVLEKENLISETTGRTDVESPSNSLSKALGPDKGQAEPDPVFIQAEEDLPDPRKLHLSSENNEKELISIVGSQYAEIMGESSADTEQDDVIVLSAPDSSHDVVDSQKIHDNPEKEEDMPCIGSPGHFDIDDSVQSRLEVESPGSTPSNISKIKDLSEVLDGESPTSRISLQDPAKDLADFGAINELRELGSQVKVSQDSKETNYQNMIASPSDSRILLAELQIVKKEREMMEAALHGAARQAQAKADEIAKLMNENEMLKSAVEELKRKSAEADIDALRDEYHQRVAALERKVYSLTREKDALRREQNKRSDAAALLKEKDEIITQVMAEGEELSKKQAAQESTIRKLRAQIREMEEEKQRIYSKLQVEEAKSESIKKDKMATEKLLQETIEKNQADLAIQKEFYANELKLAKEAEALAEARANSEVRLELESRLKESDERESMLVQALEELRQALTRTEQQAVAKEEMLRHDIDEIQKRYQASELRYNELLTEVPDSTRPLLRQIEAMQETAARKEEAWRGVERALNFRVQEAEAKAAAAEERERAMSEQLSQSLSRITVLETQITFLRTEQGQLSRTLEKERQRSSENRQEYLIAKEEAATLEGRANQLEDEIKELKGKHKKELEEEISHRQLVEMELERERTTRIELEKAASRQTSMATNQNSSNLKNANADNGNFPPRKSFTASSLIDMDESIFLQASLDPSDNLSSERRSGESNLSSYYLKSMTPSTFEAALRQKDGELASYISRLASTESTRDSLAEELVKLTRESEKFRTEAVLLPGIRAELDALRRRHNAALELMGERDEELEELRADIIDLKEMYREQINLLVNRIQNFNPPAAAN